jgi:hypothetical protein
MSLEQIESIIYMVMVISVFVIPGLGIAVIRKQKKRNKCCTYRTNAICVNRYTKKKTFGALTEAQEVTLYYTDWEFVVNGVPYQVSICVDINEFAEIGETSIIRVNPNNLSEAVKESSIMDERRKQQMKKRNLKLFYIGSLIFLVLFIIMVCVLMIIL